MFRIRMRRDASKNPNRAKSCPSYSTSPFPKVPYIIPFLEIRRKQQVDTSRHYFSALTLNAGLLVDSKVDHDSSYFMLRSVVIHIFIVSQGTI